MLSCLGLLLLTLLHVALVLVLPIAALMVPDPLTQILRFHLIHIGQIGKLMIGIERGLVMIEKEQFMSMAVAVAVEVPAMTVGFRLQRVEPYIKSKNRPGSGTGRKRRRSASPWERERYEPRPRYDDYGGYN